VKIYDVLAQYPAPKHPEFEEEAILYRDIVCKNDKQAIERAEEQHRQAGRRFKDVEFRVSSSKTILCATLIQEALHGIV
jgi:hypothetical protein